MGTDRFSLYNHIEYPWDQMSGRDIAFIFFTCSFVHISEMGWLPLRHDIELKGFLFSWYVGESCCLNEC